MFRTLLFLGMLSCALGGAYGDDGPPVRGDDDREGRAVFERDEELRRLLSRVQSARANEQVAQGVVDGLLETKTEKHPKVVAARDRLAQAQGETADALRTYQDARRTKGLPPVEGVPALPAGDARLVSARAEVELSRARLRMLMDRRAVVEDELKNLTASKTERHPKVRSAATRKVKLDVQIAEVQARIAREREHVAWLERKRDAQTPDPVRALRVEVTKLRGEMQSLRAELAEMKALLERALAK